MNEKKERLPVIPPYNLRYVKTWLPGQLFLRLKMVVTKKEITLTRAVQEAILTYVQDSERKEK